ncbi:TRIP11 [Mytilus coruscus]|uniref:TRIP11 n=1 Tax=Mytilus coruscus TaxID=42192 RepID=A0A6J8C1M1_MYTCO|nr:TRIP11 [Mytilus coruscus]
MERCEVLRSVLFINWVLISLSNGFLLTNSSTGSHGNSMTDQHYKQLVLQLSSEMISMKQELTRLSNTGKVPSAELSHLKDIIINLKESINKQQSEVLHLQIANTELLQNNTRLQLEVSQIQLVTTKLQTSTVLLQKENFQLKKNIIQLNQDNPVLQSEINQNKNDTFQLKRDIYTINGEITKLQNNGSAKQNFSSMQMEIQVCHNETNQLKHKMDVFVKSVSVNISSVGQKTDNIKAILHSLSTTSNTCCQNVHGLLKRMQDNEISIKGLSNETKQTANENKQISDELKQLSLAQNGATQKLNDIQQKITTDEQQVAMSAHPASDTFSSGIVKFNDVQFSIGINNLSTYKSTGKFVIEREGLYLISSSIFSGTNGAYYYIYLNGDQISYTSIGNDSNNPSLMQHTGTLVVARQLRSNDSVWVNIRSGITIPAGHSSTFTIVKIK